MRPGPRRRRRRPTELRETLYHTESVAGALAAFATCLFQHNAQIGILSFALGFVAGLPTLMLLFDNGLVLGAFAALFHAARPGARSVGLDAAARRHRAVRGGPLRRRRADDRPGAGLPRARGPAWTACAAGRDAGRAGARRRAHAVHRRADRGRVPPDRDQRADPLQRAGATAASWIYYYGFVGGPAREAERGGSIGPRSGRAAGRRHALQPQRAAR